MKKIKKLLFILLMVLAPLGALAADSLTYSPSSLSLDKGATGKFTITVNNAAGKLNFTSSNTSVVTVSKATDFYDTTSSSSDTITVTAVGAGTATITIKMDNFGSYDSAIGKLSNSYTINVTVTEKSDVCTLEGLSVKNGDTELLTGFSKDKDTYDLGTIDASKLVVTATKTDSKSSVSGAGTVNLEYGSSKTIVVTVTAENGAKKKYNLKYTRVDNRDTDNTLSDLKVDGITVSGFSKDKLEYSLNETMSSSIKIEATCTSAKCSKIAGTGVVNLDIGNNEKKVTVYAENGSTKIYTIKISRKEDTNLSLTKLVVDGKEIVLKTGVYNYTLDATPNSSIKIEATANASDAKLGGTGNVSLNEGNNTKEVTITSKSGNTTQVYYLNIVRSAIDKITVDGKEAKTTDYKTYSIDVDHSTQKINLKAIASKDGYSVKIIEKVSGEEVNGEYTLADDKTEFTVEVTNENGTTTSYDLVVNKEAEVVPVDDSESETSGTKISSNVLIVVIAVLLVVNIILAIYCVSLNNKKKKANKDNVDVI